jgi:hypothetical protein
MTQSKNFWGRTAILAIAGGAAFWLSNFAISRTPIAAEYRTALSISYNPMLMESLIGGLVIGLMVSYGLLHYYDRIPLPTPVQKSVLLSLIVLIVATMLLQAPASFLPETGHALQYFFIGTLFNAIRIPALGWGIGYAYDKFYGGAR